ncbi:Xaa-Pro dipeptidyl-peptidase [Baekduia alba]|uniref:CocE/NonD family hydrolase n=1 Tax=Baekduia alba TaxID=2997333 RepID=UPI0023421AAF|nr:CocE/NonD family hydrolase [Baekduia alba]WCB92066.1 Xaa-Pro dipeptidyl-peptidase [Baekduia alba]
MVRARASLVVLVVAACALLAPGAASALPYTLGPDGTTAEQVGAYASAVRQRVYIPQSGVDRDNNGVDDEIAIEIIRPATAAGDKVPAIIDPSPYYSCCGRGNETEYLGDADADGVNDKWPLFLDNYFVPRGYAVVYAEALGTANATGCVMHGGADDVRAMASVIAWLQGNASGYLGPSRSVGLVTAASWHNGKAAMIGKSYDGTLTEGVSALGVHGLTTIVPESAIDDWYRYSRMGGIRFNTHYPKTLSSTVTDTADRAACAPAWATLDADDGDATGDRNAFWEDRSYLAHVGHVTASVLAVHGLQDDNVKMDHLATWWAGLAANGVPRKLWLMRAGHADPFDVRRDAWVATLHKWFDHWLYGLDNDVMDQPRVDVEDADGAWHAEADWPAPQTQDVSLYLRGVSATAAGTVGLTSGGATDTVAWTDPTTQSETVMMNTPAGAQTGRRVFLSAPLRHDLRISGTPVVDLKASLSTTQSNLGALLVDYAPTTFTRIAQVGSEGIRDDTASSETCWGQQDLSRGDYDACYKQVVQPPTTVTQWRVTKGILDSSNRLSLTTPAAVTIGTPTAFPITLLPQDYTFAAGHQIGVILVANYTGYPSVKGTAGATVTMDTKASTISLPVTGGSSAAIASGAFDGVSPTFTVPDDQAVTAAPGASSAVATWATPTVSDDQDASPSLACTPASGSSFPIGATTVSCTAADASGNTTTGTFVVTVSATPAPPAENGGGDGDGDAGQTVGGTEVAHPTPSPTPSAPPPSVKPSPFLDTVPFRLSALTLSGRHRQVLATFVLSKDATVTVSVKRRGAKRASKTARAVLRAGRRSERIKGLKPGRYVVTITTLPNDGGPRRTYTRSLTVRAG